MNKFEEAQKDIIELEEKAIKHVTGCEKNNCNCDTCKNMCKTAPCLGTPLDMFRLIRAGYGDKIQETIYMAGVVRNTGIPPTSMFSPIWDDQKKQCVFFDNGKCILHDKGLKPLEGRTVNCKKVVLQPGEMNVSDAVAAMWHWDINQPMIKALNNMEILNKLLQR